MKNLFLLIICLALFVLTACTPQTTVIEKTVSSDASSTTDTSGTTTTTDDDDDDDDDSSDLIAVDNPWEPNCDIDGVNRDNGTNYRIWCKTINKVGRSADDGIALDDDLYWSTLYDYCTSPIPLTCTKANAFQTDSSIKVRIKVNTQPTSCGGDYYGYKFNSSYGNLRFDIVTSVRRLNGTMVEGSTVQTDWISVGSTSQVITIPAESSTDPDTPQFIDIKNVRSDAACVWYGGVDYNGYCSDGWYIKNNECWSIELQVATDFTQDFK